MTDRYSTNPNTTGTAAVMETYAKRGVDGVTDEAAVDRGSAGPVQPEATNTARAAFRRSADDTAALPHESVELTRVLPRIQSGPPGLVYPSPPPARKRAVGSPAADADADPDGVIIAAVVVLFSLLGVIATLFAYHQGRVHGSAGMPLYWCGQILVFVPTMVAALRRGPPPLAAAALMAVGLGINQYLIMWLYSPDEFRFPDELQHMTATSIVNHTGRLFESNPALPIGSSFPGLAEIGSAVSEITGLSITTSGMIIAFVCRLVFIGALFAGVWRISGRPRIALLACVLYTTSQHYLFFNAMYVYQAGGLAFALVCLWATIRLRSASSTSLTVIALVTAAATTMTHHITAGFLCVSLAAIGLVSAFARTRTARPLLVAGAAAATTALWLAFPGRATFDYLLPPLRAAWASAIGLLHGGSSHHAPTVNPTSTLDLGIQLIALVVVFVIVVGAVVALRHTGTPFQWLLVAAAATYFASSALHVMGSEGPELAGRASTFTFLPAAGLLAWRGDRWLADRRRHLPPWHIYLRPTVLGCAAVVLMIAGRVGGWPPTWETLPGKVIVSGFESAVTPSSVRAAEWTKSWLGPDNRIGADITGWTLVASYGRQNPVAEVGPLFYSGGWDLADATLVAGENVEFLWVDARLSQQPPVSGSFFLADPRAGQNLTPLRKANLTKFDTVTFVRRVYDDGTIRIYDLRGTS
ncbi:MAG TPA: hypothetical protein VIR00_10595 [Micromonosporaceae bacterium]